MPSIPSRCPTPGLSVSIVFSFISLVFLLSLVTFQERKMFKKILSLEPLHDPSWWHFMACLPQSMQKNWHWVRTLKMFSLFESAKIFKAPSVWLPPLSNHHLRAQLRPISHFSASSLPWSLWSPLSKITRCLPDTKKTPHNSYFLHHFCHVLPCVIWDIIRISL